MVDKKCLAEIDSRIRLCLEFEDKLNYLDTLLKDKKIGELEYGVFKQGILENKPEEEVRKDIDDYIERAVILKKTLRHEDRNHKIKISIVLIIILFMFLLIAKSPTLTGLFVSDQETQDTENSTHAANLKIKDIINEEAKK